MEMLRLLQLDFVHLSGSYEYLSGRLVWLSWKGFSLTCIPSTIIMDNLVAIDLSHSKLKQVWRGTKVMCKLKYLNLSHSIFLIRTPDFTGLNSLEKLLLSGCTKLVDVNQSIGCLNSLVVLDLNNCENLEKIPLSIFMLKSLIDVNLSGCSKLQWPTYFQRSSLESSILSLQFSSRIRKLAMEGCNITHVPIEIGSLMSLEFLNLGRNNFSNLPATIANLPTLKVLLVNMCSRLESIGALPVNLLGLSAHYCTSLQSVSMESKAAEAVFMACFHCPKLVNNNFTYNFRRNILHYAGLDEKRQYNIVVTGSEIPRWCNNQRDGNVVRFRVDRMIQGFILCVAFSGRYNQSTSRLSFIPDLFNITEGDLSSLAGDMVGFDHPKCEDHPSFEDQMWLSYVPNQTEGPDSTFFFDGEEVEITTRTWTSDLRVNKCGVSLVYEDDEKDTDTSAEDVPRVDENVLAVKPVRDSNILLNAGIFTGSVSFVGYLSHSRKAMQKKLESSPRENPN
ncbi:disease resistance protein RPS4B-like [Cornus florida]|uniref:disease resistance protein RPS4B-like n=1 Tax=Cornus florida TaxID=4283 RepID=UPI002897AD2B|nr:disease resistance protein RPS4B-like [Cornus florida]